MRGRVSREACRVSAPFRSTHLDTLCPPLSSDGSLALWSGHEVLYIHRVDAVGAAWSAGFLSRTVGQGMTTAPPPVRATITCAAFVAGYLFLGDDTGVLSVHDHGVCRLRQRLSTLPIIGLSVACNGSGETTSPAGAAAWAPAAFKPAPCRQTLQSIWLLLHGGRAVSFAWDSVLATVTKAASLQAAGEDATLTPPLAFAKWSMAGQGSVTCLAVARPAAVALFDGAWAAACAGDGQRGAAPPPSTTLLTGGSAPCLAMSQGGGGGAPPSLTALTSAVAERVSNILASAVAGIDSSALGSVASSLGFGSWASSLGLVATEQEAPQDPAAAIRQANADAAAKLRSAVPRDLQPCQQLPDMERAVEGVAVDASGRLALTRDAFGRVLLVRTDDLGLLHVWKGFRGAQVAWQVLPQYGAAPGGGGKGRCVTAAVLYAPSRGLLEVWEVPAVRRLGCWDVGRHARLVQVGSAGCAGGWVCALPAGAAKGAGHEPHTASTCVPAQALLLVPEGGGEAACAAAEEEGQEGGGGLVAYAVM